MTVITPTFSIVYSKFNENDKMTKAQLLIRNLRRTSKIKEYLLWSKVFGDICYMRQILANTMTNCQLINQLALNNCSMWEVLCIFHENIVKTPLNGIQEDNLSNISYMNPVSIQKRGTRFKIWI